MNPDIRRLQILNDLVAQTIEAINVRGAAPGGLAHTTYQEVGQTYPQFGAVPFPGVQAQLGQQIPGQVQPHLWQQIPGQMQPQFGQQIPGQMQPQFGQQIPTQPWQQLPAHLYAQLGQQVPAHLYGQLGQQVPQQLYGQLGQQVPQQLYGQQVPQSLAGGLPVGGQVGAGQVPGFPFMVPGMRPEMGGLMHSPFVGVPFQPGQGWIDPRLLALQAAQFGQQRYGAMGAGFPYGVI